MAGTEGQRYNRRPVANSQRGMLKVIRHTRSLIHAPDVPVKTRFLALSSHCVVCTTPAFLPRLTHRIKKPNEKGVGSFPFITAATFSPACAPMGRATDRKSTRLNSSHSQ